MVKESHALPQDTQPHILPRADLPNAPPAYDLEKDNYKRYVSKRCSADQVASEARGWAEAGVLANALSEWLDESADLSAQLMARETRRLEANIRLPECYGYL